MTTSDDVISDPKGRRRGGPRRISRTLIVDAARGMDPQRLTMQAVADALGVDRKALNYHVRDREGLLRLVALDLFDSTFATNFQACFDTVGGSSQEDWKDATRAWAIAVRDSMVSTGRLMNSFSLSTDGLTVLQPAERVLQQMMRAGFDIGAAGRGLTFLTNFALGVGRDIIMQNQLGEHPQATEVRHLLEQSDDERGYEAFRGLVALNINSPRDIETQFDFEVDVFILGMERLLDADHEGRSK